MATTEQPCPRCAESVGCPLCEARDAQADEVADTLAQLSEQLGELVALAARGVELLEQRAAGRDDAGDEETGT